MNKKTNINTTLKMLKFNIKLLLAILSNNQCDICNITDNINFLNYSITYKCDDCLHK